MADEELTQLSDDARKAVLQAIPQKLENALPDGVLALAQAWSLVRDPRGPIQVEADYELARSIMGNPEALVLAQQLSALALEDRTAAAHENRSPDEDYDDKEHRDDKT